MNDTNNNADVYTEGTPIFLDTPLVDIEEKTTTESQTEIKQEVTTEPKEEEEIPFHKHPRWKKMQEDKEILAEQLEETRKRVEELSKAPQKEEPISVPNWWKEQYGDDETSTGKYKQYLTNNEEFKEQVVEEAINKIKTEQQQAEQSKKEAEEKANQYVEESLETLKAEGKQFDKNELLKFMLDFEKEYNIPIVYTEGELKGNYNFAKAYELMTKLNPKEKSDVIAKKKEIASETMNARPASTSEVPIINRQSLRNGDWRNSTK
jgi:hypothetical protein